MFLSETVVPKEVTELLQDVKNTFESSANPAKAAGMKAYMKNQFKFLGISSVERRAMYPPIKTELKSLNKSMFQEWCTALWELPYREYHYLAVDMIQFRKKELEISDLEYLELLITHKSWWDTVDALATGPVGYILYKQKAYSYDFADKWIRSDNIWLQRTAILFQLKYREKTDRDLLFSLIEIRQESPEFFIRKASGWALRQYARTDPRAVLDFVTSHPGLSGLTIREALKHIQ